MLLPVRILEFHKEDSRHKEEKLSHYFRDEFAIDLAARWKNFLKPCFNKGSVPNFSGWYDGELHDPSGFHSPWNYAVRFKFVHWYHAPIYYLVLIYRIITRK